MTNKPTRTFACLTFIFVVFFFLFMTLFLACSICLSQFFVLCLFLTIFQYALILSFLSCFLKI